MFLACAVVPLSPVACAKDDLKVIASAPVSAAVSDPAAIRSNDDAVTITKRQAPAAFQAFRTAPNGSPINIFQAIVLNGSVIDSTTANFLATAKPDNVTFSGWGIRGGLGTNPLVVSNFGAWFENNAHIVWAQEIDVNNEGATQPEGSDKGGVGLAVQTGSTYSPDTAITVRRMKGAGSGPGFLRGLVIEGARNVGVRIVAMDSKTYPQLDPNAPGTITALQVARSSDSTARFSLDENGGMTWGSGSSRADVTLSRTAPSVLTIGGAINDTAEWTAFIPACHALSGTIKAATASGRYNRMGQRVFFSLNLHITRNGSGAGAIRCTLPVAANRTLIQVAAGRETGVSGKALTATLDAESAEILDYASHYPGADGAILAVSGAYEAR